MRGLDEPELISSITARFRLEGNHSNEFKKNNGNNKRVRALFSLRLTRWLSKSELSAERLLALGGGR